MLYILYVTYNYSNVPLIIYFISVIEAKKRFIATVNPHIYNTILHLKELASYKIQV